MNRLKGKTVLVTGAAGFIGSHLVERLLTDDVIVRALLRYDSQNRLGALVELDPQLCSRIDIVRGDLKDPEAVLRATTGCEIVFHLGALVTIPFSYTNPTDYVQTNIVGTANVLNACLQARVARLIHVSTSEVYGTAQFVPITVEHPRRAQSPYAATKIAADALVLSYVYSFGLPATILRPFNTYGPRQTARAIIPTIVSQALTDQPIRLGNLNTSRDYLYITDTIEALMLLAATSKLPDGTEIQIGTGVETSTRELVQLIGALLGKELTVAQEDARIRPPQSEVYRLVADRAQAAALLGWSPRVSLHDGIEREITWLRERTAAPLSREEPSPGAYLI